MQRPSVPRYFAYALILMLVGSLFSAALPLFQPSYASHTNIAVKVDKDIEGTYGDNDDVTIDGTIDDVQSNLDSVDIIIKDSENDEVESRTVDLGSSDNFDMVYNVAGTDPDGAYTVEVQYDDENVFTYFIVDNDDDLVRVVLDNNDKVYEAGNDVEITGQVDDVVDGEPEVEITVLDPNGDKIVNQDNAELGEGTLSNDEFEYTFELDNDADHGRYAVIVGYDNDDQLGWDLFEIEDNDSGGSSTDGDSGTDGDITAEIGEATYAPGDTVSVTGNIDNYQSSNELEITVEDPDGVDIESENDVSVQSNGDFEFEFDLDDNADEVQYDVTLKYDTDELVLTFDVDEGGSTSGDGDSGTDGDITAEIGEATYAPGDTVSVTGNIDNYQSSNELEITVEDPDGVDIESENDVSVQSNGDFEFEFDLDDNADEVQYDVTLKYDTDELVLTFDVDEGGSTSGGSSSTITVKLNKSSYLAGELVTVTGTVPKIVEDEVVSVLLYYPDGRVILEASKYVEPTSDKKYSTTIRLDSDLDEDDNYSIKAAYDQKETEVEFDITGQATGTGAMNVKTDKATYQSGSTVRITGNIAEDLIVPSEDQVLLRFNAPDNNPCRIDPVDLASDGSFSYSLVLGGKCGLAGEYDVIATYNHDDFKTTFVLEGELQGGSIYNLNIEGKTYQIEYEISGASIDSMIARTGDKKLVINIDADEDGQLTIVLPRQVIDSIGNGQDIAYVVSLEDEAGDIKTIDVNESNKTNNARTLVIDYSADTDRIEITGTQIVPEFGPIAIVVMVVAIAGIIVATARLGNNKNGNYLGLFGQ